MRTNYGIIQHYCGMHKRTSKDVRKAILEILKDGRSHSLGDLERKTGTNWQSVRNHVEDLLLFNAIKKEKYEKHYQNKRPYIEITITKEGLELLKKL